MPGGVSCVVVPLILTTWEILGLRTKSQISEQGHQGFYDMAQATYLAATFGTYFCMFQKYILKVHSPLGPKQIELFLLLGFCTFFNVFLQSVLGQC